MAMILATLFAILYGITFLQTSSLNGNSSFLPCPKTEPTKYAYEMYSLYYTPFWMLSFAIVIACELYENFTSIIYNLFCGSLALPFLLQPLLLPAALHDSPDAKRPFLERYST